MKPKTNPQKVIHLKQFWPTQRISVHSLAPVTPIAAFSSFANARAGIRRSARSLFCIALLLMGGAAAVRGQSPLDGFDPNADGVIFAVVVQPDGKILIGGGFTTLSPNGGPSFSCNHLARLNADGTRDVDFHLDAPEQFGGVSSLAVQADGKILVGGLFTTLGGQPRRNMARLDGATGLADAFQRDTDGIVRAIAVQPNGRILIGGAFAHVGTEVRNNIARLDPNGSVDLTFNPNANGPVNAIVQAPGGIFIGGNFTTLAPNLGLPPVTQNRIAKLYGTGRVDPLFHPNPNGTAIFALAVQADGKILAGGDFDTIDGQPRNRIARLDATGVADDFNPNANDDISSIAVQADGKILVGGRFNGTSSIGGADRKHFARLHATGATAGLADNFDPNAQDNVLAIAVQADGKILAAGVFTSMGGQPRNHIARLEIEGQLDRTLLDPLLSPNTAASPIFATAIQADGKILVGGSFNQIFGQTRHNIARLNTDGTLDEEFTAGVDGVPFPHPTLAIVYSIAVQTDGRILVGGVFVTVNGTSQKNIARLESVHGAVDPNFVADPDADGTVFSIAVQADDAILVGGSFTRIGQTSQSYIARLDPMTGAATNFNPEADGTVYSITVQTDGNILVGGDFMHIGLEERHRIARLDHDGVADVLFNPNADDTVYAIAVQPDGKVLAGGEFGNIGDEVRFFLARLDAVTGLADSFDANGGGENVYTIAVQADGKVLAGGEFGVGSSGYIVRMNPDGTLDSGFTLTANNTVRSIAIQADGKILAGGNFSAIGSLSGPQRYGFARLSNDTPALQNVALTRIPSLNLLSRNLTWTRDGSSPPFTRVTFERSDDNAAYLPLGDGVATGSNWTLTGLTFPTGANFYIRARGYYRSGNYNGSESITETVRNIFLRPNRALNISTRAPVGGMFHPATEDGSLVQTGNDPAIGGFIITGSAPKHVLLRAIGPSLSSFGVPGALQDPVMELHGPGAFVTITNNNWRETQEAAILATGIPPTDNRESAIDATLVPGAYTAVVTGNGNTSGVALIEVYDLEQEALSKLANISTRAFVGTADNIVIAGFIVGSGDGDSRIVVRGIGPTLTAFGVPNALANPTLELRDNNGALLVSNNDWQDDPAQAAELTAASLAPTNNLESAVAITLPPGPYTALLRGFNNGTGVGLVEVYDRGAP